MYYVQKGTSGDAILWLHGWGCDGSIFLPIADKVDGRVHYFPDLSGFGRTPAPPVPYSVADYADEVYRFILANKLTNVLIVGHSFGCRVALVLAANHPECVSRMLLVSPAALRTFSLRRWWHERVYKWKKRLGRVDCSHAGRDWLECDGVMRGTLVRVVNEDLSRYAKQVCCPVVIVNGDSDTATPLVHAKKLCRLIPHASLVTIVGGHFAFFRTPQAFARTVECMGE